MEILAGGILLWMLLYSSSLSISSPSPGGRETDSTATATPTMSSSSTANQTITFIALVNAFKGIVQQLSSVLEQRKYITAEFGEYAPAAAILETAFSAEDVPGYDVGPG